MGERRHPFREGHLLTVIASRFEGVSEVDAGSLVAAEAVAGLIEFEANLHVGNRVRCHQEFVAMEPWKQMFRHLVIPERLDLLAGVTLCLPFRDELRVTRIVAAPARISHLPISRRSQQPIC